MYRYTAKKSIIRTMNVTMKPGTRWWDLEWKTLSQILKTDDYVMKTTFRSYYENICFYSEKRRTKVPLNGILFPVHLFEEEII